MNPPPSRGSDSTRRIPIGRWVLGVALLFGLYAWTFGPYGVFRQWKASNDLEQTRRNIDSLRAENLRRVDSLRLLQGDSATIAAEARRQGLVLPDEISVRFVDTALGAPKAQ